MQINDEQDIYDNTAASICDSIQSKDKYTLLWV